MLALAADSRGVFHVDLELRYVPVTAAVKSLVSAGAIGPPLLVRVMLECDWGRQWATGESVGGLSTWYIDAIDALIEEPAAPPDERRENLTPDDRKRLRALGYAR